MDYKKSEAHSDMGLNIPSRLCLAKPAFRWQPEMRSRISSQTAQGPSAFDAKSKALNSNEKKGSLTLQKNKRDAA